MKKVLVFCLVMVLAFSMSLTVVADAGGFVSSPTGKKAPVLDSYTNESEDCDASLIISSYTDRDQLSEAKRKAIEEAYAQIKATYDLSTLNIALAKYALELGVPVSHLSVSDLFDISCAHDEGHEEHGKFTVTLKSESLQNFVCLLHYVDGEWVIVENAEVEGNGRSMTFEEDEFSPFAIVVYNGGRVVYNEIEVESEINRVLLTISIVTTAAAVISTFWAVSERSRGKKNA